MTKVLMFWMDLLICLNVMKNVVHLEMTDKRWRLICSLIPFCLWSIYKFHAVAGIPDTFCILVILSLLFSEKWYLKLCVLSAYSLALNILSTVGIYLYYIITNTGFQDYLHCLHISSIATLSCVLALSIYFGKKLPTSVKPLDHLNGKGCALIIAVTVIDFILSSVASLLFYETISAGGRKLLTLCIIAMIFMSVILLILYFRLQHYHSLLRHTSSMNEKVLRMEEQHYQGFQKKNEDLRAFRHDYNFHIAALKALADSDDLPGLKQYVDTLSQMKEQTHYLSTNHPVADAIVNYFYEALPENASLEIEGKFPESCFVEDSDLCVILSNLVKNAFEAISREPQDKKTRIFLSIFASEDYLTILVENTCTYGGSEKNRGLTTTKPDATNHGFGLKNVRTALGKYQGNLDLSRDNDLFTASCYLRRG